MCRRIFSLATCCHDFKAASIFLKNNIINENKISQSFQNTVVWVLNHMQYLHLLPAIARCQLWTDRRNSSFRKISVTESMFTFTEAPRRTRVLGNSCSVLQSCSCLLSLALSASSHSASQGPDTSIRRTPHLLTHTHTPPNLLFPVTTAIYEEQQRESLLQFHRSTPCWTARLPAPLGGWSLTQACSASWTPLVVTGRKCGLCWKPHNEAEQPAHEHWGPATCPDLSVIVFSF